MGKNILLFSIFILLVSCGNQTITTYNDTIVVAHDKLIKINADFFYKCESFVGKPESKQTFKKLIEETKVKIAETKKPVEELIPIKDHGFRDAILEMFSKSEDSMATFSYKAGIITGQTSQQEAIDLFMKEYELFNELDVEIRDIQSRYAYYNNAQLR
jgi:hypothetical protein